MPSPRGAIPAERLPPEEEDGPEPEQADDPRHARGSAPAASPAAGTVDEARATKIANAMAAFYAGDYAGWSRHWSAAMKSGVNEQAFLGFRAQAMEQLGTYVSIESAERVVKQPGTYRWVFTIRFEKGTATIGFGFQDGSTQVAGVHVG